MTNKQRETPWLTRDFLEKNRKYVWSLVAVAVYAALGFFLAPWLVEKNLTASVRENFAAELRLEAVAINPFVLSLRMDGIELDDPSGAPIARINQLFVNFQLSSLFRWAWTFDEFRLTAPEFFIARDELGNLNLAYLFSQSAENHAIAENEVEPAVTPALIFDFAIENGTINWRDDVPAETVETRFGPINIEIAELNTLPGRSGQQSVLITTDSAGTLSWTGGLQLNPLKSVAHASVKGSHFPLLSAYIRHQSGFDIVDGHLDVELNYTIDTMPDGAISAAVDDFNLTLTDLAVDTFSGSDPADSLNQDREVLRLPDTRLINGTLRWPEKSVSIASLTLDDARVSLFRDATGTLNVVRARSDPALEDRESDGGPADPTANGSWLVSLQSFAINHLALGLKDHGVEPFADIGIADFNLKIGDITNEPGAQFPIALALQVRTGGTLSADGLVSVLPEVELELDLVVDNIALAGAHPYIKPLADVNMDSGALNLSGHLRSSSQETLSFAGDLSIVDFEITETDEGSRLGSWRRLDANHLALSISEQELEISEILLHQLYGDIVIAADGSLNLGRVEKMVNDKAPEDTQEARETASNESAMAITIGRIVLTEAAADFADFSLPLPFSAKIEDLNGNMTTISTRSSEASTVSFEGKVDDNGFVRVTGSVTPLNPSAKTNLSVVFQNVFVPKFSSYTIPFAGREIASGSLDLSLGYQVTDSQLVGENSIILRDLTLGEKVPHPDAMSLPLGLAIALLKDADGKIDIDLPVRGDLNDPQFSYGGVIGKALGNLIIKIVASPFTLLGKLLGVEADELEYINFLNGRADLIPPELERAAQIAEALSLRPELVLEISGVADADADGLALRTSQLDATVEERIADLDAAQSDTDMYSKQLTIVLEALFVEVMTAGDSALALENLRAQFTTESDNDDSSTPTVEFDELAFTNALRKKLIENQPLSESTLADLASKRAENTRVAILENNKTLEKRINIVASKSIAKKSDEMIRMRVTLSIGESD
jgi:hypothetical protein